MTNSYFGGLDLLVLASDPRFVKAALESVPPFVNWGFLVHDADDIHEAINSDIFPFG